MPSSRGSMCEDEDGSPQPRIVRNRYQVVRRLGNLGLDGVAYLVRDLQSEDGQQLRTLKEIHVGQLSPGQLRQLLDEAEMLGQLRHLLLSPPLDSFLDGEFYCSVSPFWDEGDLGQVLIACKQAGRHLPESQIAAWFVQLCLAVRYLHSRGVIHRNLKSSNVFLDSGRIRVGDLCPSLLMLGHHKATTSIFYGTPHYTSPEVLRHNGVTSQCDLWSLGCILFEMCHLRYAFDSQSMMGVVYNVVRNRRNPLPSGPRQYGPELLSAIDALLRPAAEERERSVGLLTGKFFAHHLRSLRDHLLASDPEIARVLARREAAARAAEARERAAEAARLEEERLLAEVRGGAGGRRRPGDANGEDGANGEEGDGRGGPLVQSPGLQLPYSGRGSVSLTLACEADWERRMRGFLNADGSSARHPVGLEPMRSDTRLVGRAGIPAGQDFISRALYSSTVVNGRSSSQSAGGRRRQQQQQRQQASSMHYDIAAMPLRIADTPRDGPLRVEPGSTGFSLLTDGSTVGGARDNGADALDDEAGYDSDRGRNDDSQDGDEDDDDGEELAAALQPHPGADLVEQIDRLAPLPCVTDNVCFTPASRLARIDQLRRQALARLPRETFDRLAAFLREARRGADWKEAGLQDRLAAMHPRLADCFLVDQLVFLEACQREE